MKKILSVLILILISNYSYAGFFSECHFTLNEVNAKAKDKGCTFLGKFINGHLKNRTEWTWVCSTPNGDKYVNYIYNAKKNKYCHAYTNYD
jgi:hypothetical protein